MKSLLTSLALATVLAQTAHAATTFGFEGNDLTTTGGSPLTTTVTIQNAYWETEDEFGDPLATPGFRADTSSPTVAANPLDSGYGAPISGKALDGTNGPVMFTFASALNIGSFGVVLDNSTFGNIPITGGNPAFGTNILFYDAADNLIGYIALDQTVSGFTVADTGTYENVSKIVLPGGAFYDNLSFTAQSVPEPTAAALAGLGMLALLRRRR
ncbi:MAG: PEP-CTERM sorting domain-containing protein [Luteolibacter sp.]